MNYKLDVTKDSLEFAEQLEPKRFKQVINKTLSLLTNPKPNDSQKLVGYDEYIRVDVGEYRIIYRLQDEVVKVALIGKRNDDEVYKQFERKMR